MRFLACLLALLAAANSHAQIVVPATIEAHKPLVATLSDPIPEGAAIELTWRVEGGEFLPLDGRSVHIWAAPGAHKITARGYWLLTKRVTLPDGQAFDALLGFGQIDHEATVTVGGPSPPPPPPGKAWGVILEETSERTPQQAALWLQARTAFKSGPKFLILDDDSPDAAPYLRHASALPRPALVVLADDGALVSAAPCPMTLDAIKKALGR